MFYADIWDYWKDDEAKKFYYIYYKDKTLYFGEAIIIEKKI